MFQSREKRLGKEIPKFMHENKDLLLIICDPKTDTIFMGYKDQMISGKIKSPTGKNLKVIQGVLRESLFEDRADMFLSGLVEVMRLPVRKGNQFLMFLDGALFNIAKALRKSKKRSSASMQGGQGIASPFVERVEKGS